MSPVASLAYLLLSSFNSFLGLDSFVFSFVGKHILTNGHE